MNKLINSKYQIYLEIALIINNNLYTSKKINYSMYKTTENTLLKKLKEFNY